MTRFLLLFLVQWSNRNEETLKELKRISIHKILMLWHMSKSRKNGMPGSCRKNKKEKREKLGIWMTRGRVSLMV